MDYHGLEVRCSPDFVEILIAELADQGFNSFEETESGFNAYSDIPPDEAVLVQITSAYPAANISYSRQVIPQQNWNAGWEKTLEPVVIGEKCLICPQGHPLPGTYPVEVAIAPNMSFGTGDHPTTHLMVQHQLRLDHHDKRVLDVGCGTAILSIVASKLGARFVEALDIDERSIQTAHTNLVLNALDNIHLQKKDIKAVSFANLFDLILANINKNALEAEISHYYTNLKVGGRLIMSGFYEKDVAPLLLTGQSRNFDLVERDTKDGWALLTLQKVK